MTRSGLGERPFEQCPVIADFVAKVGVAPPWLLSCRVAKESHLRALPKPCVNLSIHTASDVHRWHTSRRLDLVHGLLLLPDGFSWPAVSAEQRGPFGPAKALAEDRG